MSQFWSREYLFWAGPACGLEDACSPQLARTGVNSKDAVAVQPCMNPLRERNVLVFRMEWNTPYSQAVIENDSSKKR